MPNIKIHEGCQARRYTSIDLEQEGIAKFVGEDLVDGDEVLVGDRLLLIKDIHCCAVKMIPEDSVCIKTWHWGTEEHAQVVAGNASAELGGSDPEPLENEGALGGGLRKFFGVPKKPVPPPVFLPPQQN